jgi:hypothetical protein
MIRDFRLSLHRHIKVAREWFIFNVIVVRIITILLPKNMRRGNMEHSKSNINLSRYWSSSEMEELIHIAAESTDLKLREFVDDIAKDSIPEEGKEHCWWAS